MAPSCLPNRQCSVFELHLLEQEKGSLDLGPTHQSEDPEEAERLTVVKLSAFVVLVGFLIDSHRIN